MECLLQYHSVPGGAIGILHKENGEYIVRIQTTYLDGGRSRDEVFPVNQCEHRVDVIKRLINSLASSQTTATRRAERTEWAYTSTSTLRMNINRRFTY
jgi:hypothetical protein